MGMEGEGNEASEFSLSRLFHNLETAESADALKYDPPGRNRKKKDKLFSYIFYDLISSSLLCLKVSWDF